jgi:hypothetical protein
MIMAARKAPAKGRPMLDRTLKELKMSVDALGRMIGTFLPGGGGGPAKTRKRSTVKTAAHGNRSKKSTAKPTARKAGRRPGRRRTA